MALFTSVCLSQMSFFPVNESGIVASTINRYVSPAFFFFYPLPKPSPPHKKKIMECGEAKKDNFLLVIKAKNGLVLKGLIM